MKFFKKHCARC